MSNYSYNGIILPELPEYDVTTYPYASIDHYVFDDGSTGNFLYVFSTPFVTIDLTEQYGYVSLQVEDGGKYVQWEYYPDRHSEWVGANVPITSDNWESSTAKVSWTNTDIYNPDGTLYLAASEPVASEPSIVVKADLQPLSFTLGWLAGRRMAIPAKLTKLEASDPVPVYE